MAALGHAIAGRQPRTGHAYSATLKTLRIPGPEHVARDDKTLYFAGPIEDPVGADVTV